MSVLTVIIIGIVVTMLINHGTLAKLMFPNVTNPSRTFYKKFHNIEGRRFTFADKELIKQIIKDVIQ